MFGFVVLQSRISIQEVVCLFVGPFVQPTVCRLVRHKHAEILRNENVEFRKYAFSFIFDDQNYG